MFGKDFSRRDVSLVNRLRRSVLVFGFWFFGSQLAMGQEALTLHDASRRVLQNNPELQVFQWQQQAVDGLRQTSELRPGFELGFEAENILGSGQYSGTDSAEYTLTLSSIIELGGKRDSRVAVANSHYTLAEIEREAKALDLIGQVTQRFIAVLALQEKLQVSEETTRVAETALDIVTLRVERGAAPEADRLRAEAALAQTRLRHTEIESQLAIRRMTLATLWGDAASDFDVLLGDIYASEPAVSFDELYQRVTESPAIQVFATEARLRDAETALASSRASSDVHWTLGVRRFEATADTAFLAAVSVPLFTGTRNQGAVHSAQAERSMVDSQQQASLLTLRARLYEAWQSHQQAVNATRQMRESVLPLLEEALTQTREAYEMGRYRYIDLVSAQQELLEARVATINAASTALFNQTLIEQLTAQPLSASRVQPLH